MKNCFFSSVDITVVKGLSICTRITFSQGQAGQYGISYLGPIIELRVIAHFMSMVEDS